MNKRPSPIAELVLARWRSFYREPGVLFWSFGFPLVLAIALGIAFRNRAPEPVMVAVQSGPGASEVEHALEGADDVRVRTLDEEAARAALRTGKVSIVVVPGSPRSYHFDATRPESRLARAVVDDRLQRADGRADVFESTDQLVTEPGSRYIDFLIPGLIGTGLMQGGLWGVGYVIVEMRTRKLMKRLLATPMKKRDFLLAFVLVRALFLIVELPVLLLFAALVFDVPMRGSAAFLVAVATLGSLSFAGLGLLVASRAENIQTASGLINLASLPMLIVSGTFFSSGRFPDVVQPFVRALPLTALNDALRAIMLDGAGINGIATELAVLAGWGIASFVLALKLFRWR
ncbi:MAG: ABC transporter permease [Polyangiaceae bacterium]|nr:ABC transporter permease [Polyangiaceae bacterium]